MKVSVTGITDVKCEGCGGMTRLAPNKKYRMPEDLACNCVKKDYSKVELTPVVGISATLDEVLMGLHNGAELGDFDQASKELYSEYIIKEFEQNKADGVVQDDHDNAEYALCLTILNRIGEANIERPVEDTLAAVNNITGVDASLLGTAEHGLSATELALNNPELDVVTDGPSEDAVDLTTLKKSELKKICDESTPPIVYTKKTTNDQFIVLILAAQDSE